MGAAGIADAVWDEADSGHRVAGTFGNDVFVLSNEMYDLGLDYARRTAYAYDTPLANGASFAPAAGTVVMQALLDCVPADGDLTLLMDVNVRICATSSIGSHAIIGPIYCEGTNTKFQNNEGAQQNLVLEGMTP